MLLKLATCDVRSWQTSDVDSLVAHANNRRIWLNLRDAFPHPYTRHDARDFIRAVRQREPETTFAIAVDGEAVGSIVFVMHSDVERVSAEIGYWLRRGAVGR
jgi:RimJ/RimL family protein N-acetyltransferase